MYAGGASAEEPVTIFATIIDIAAPPDRVWSVIADVERWPEWTPSVRSITLLQPGPLVVGSRARILQPRLPPAVWQVTALEDGRSFTWMSASPGVRVVATHGVDAAGPGSRASLTLRFAGLLGPLVGWMARGMTERYLALEAEGLRRRSIGAI